MQAFATDIAVYIACPSCSQTGLVDQSTLSAARMRRAQVTLTCHACGEQFDAAEAQEVILPHVSQETLDLPLTARGAIDAEAEAEEPEPRYARASDHEPLTRFQSLHDVWQHLGAETADDAEDNIAPTLPSWLQKKDNSQSESAQADTSPSSKPDEVNTSDAPDTKTAPMTNNQIDDETNADIDLAAAPPDLAEEELAGLAGKLSRPDIGGQTVDLISIEKHLPALPEVGAVEEELEEQDNATTLNWPLAIFGAMLVVFSLLAGVLYF